MSARLSKQQLGLLEHVGSRTHGLTSARITAAECSCSFYVCRTVTLLALKKKKLLHVQHEGMRNYWLSITPAGRKMLAAH